MNNLCIIPARGGSKRIPRKNIKSFLGKPIIAYSVEVALKSGLFSEVMVSTDDEEIAKIAKSFGAKVPFFRSDENANDYATTLDVVKEVLLAYERLGKSYDNVCTLYPTAPFVSTRKLKEGFDKLTHANAVIPVTEFSFPVWRAFHLNQDSLAYHWPEFEKSRSQDLTKLFHDAGQWYWIKIKNIEDTLVPQQTAAVILSTLEVQDIDRPEDWHIAEMKYEYLQSIK
jgi:N-acylneuraminate cytidylyltransferase